MCRTSPELIESIRSQSDKQKRISHAIKSSARLQRINTLSSASHTKALRSWSKQEPAAAALEESAKNLNRSETFQLRLKAAPITIEEEEVEEKEFEAIACDVELKAGIGHETLSNEIELLLEQLIVEPTDSSELTAKFSLFESFSLTVTTLRDQTMQFYEDNIDHFEGEIKASIQKDIRKLDSADAWSITDDPTKWFVYGMTKKSNENSISIQRVLASITAKLAALDEELGECPFCIEIIQKGNEKMLGCCHKVCVECWRNWVAIKGHAAFCPLCRHQEFITDILSSDLLP